MARCYAQVTLVDAAAGVILDALKEYGFYDNTIVIMTTDHGDCLACHGGHFDKAYYMPQELLKIPMAIRYPGYFKPGTVVNNYVSNMDVPVTLLEAAGLSFPEKTDGVPLMSLCAGALPKRRYMVCETHGHKESYLGRALIMGDYKYIYNHDDIDELYHLKNDPFELRNLVENGSFLPVLREYKTLLSEWADTGGDVLSESI
jgi:arylsulfatase A-like enzyme